MSDFNLQLHTLSKVMSFRLKRHAAIAGNIANADTPGYRPRQLAFEDSLQKAIENKSLSQVQSAKAKIMKVDDHTPKENGNSVNLDAQMARMTENSLIYNATAEFLGKKMRMVKSVLQ